MIKRLFVGLLVLTAAGVSHAEIAQGDYKLDRLCEDGSRIVGTDSMIDEASGLTVLPGKKIVLTLTSRDFSDYNPSTRLGSKICIRTYRGNIDDDGFVNLSDLSVACSGNEKIQKSSDSKDLSFMLTVQSDKDSVTMRTSPTQYEEGGSCKAGTNQSMLLKFTPVQ